MKPAIFNTAMVRAILALIKKNTRRPFSKYLKKVIDSAYAMGEIGSNGIDSDFDDSDKKYLMSFASYQVGDVIYVRETFVVGVPDGTEPESESNPVTVFYKADDSVHGWMNEDWDEVNIPWKPSIHMPKEYARLFLRVKDVRIERLNEINSADAKAEGIDENNITDAEVAHYMGYTCDAYVGYYDHKYIISAFAKLWESIYGNGSFDNRYVWVIEFERISKEEAINE